MVLSIQLPGCGSSSNKKSNQTSASNSAAAVTTKAIENPAPPGQSVPVLMYHVIAPPPAGAPYPELYLTPERFKQQVDALASAGYNAVTLDQVYNYWEKDGKLPKNPVVFTFDDGYRSVYKSAFPVLQLEHWPAVLNLEIKIMDDVWGLSPAMVKKMIAAGWELGSHTINHLDVSTLDANGLRQEITGSREQLKKQFNVPVNFFCYPSGRYDDQAIAAVKKAGYLGATTTNPGLANKNQTYTLSRVRVNGSTSADALVQQINSFK